MVYPQMYQSMFQQQQHQQAPAIVSVRSEQEVFNFPVGYGETVVFKHENEPFVYVKAMGFSQLDPPKMEKYRRVDEGEQITQYVNRNELDELRKKIEALESKLGKKGAKDE